MKTLGTRGEKPTFGGHSLIRSFRCGHPTSTVHCPLSTVHCPLSTANLFCKPFNQQGKFLLGDWLVNYAVKDITAFIGAGHICRNSNHLYIKGSSSGSVEYKEGDFVHSSGEVKWDNYDKYNAGLAGMLVAPVMHLHRDESSTGNDMTFSQTQFRNQCHNGGLNRSDCFVSKDRGDGVIVGACYLTNQSNLTSGWDFENTLIIGGGCPTMYQGTMKNCTYLNVDSTKVLEIDIQTGGFPWGTMDDESFELAKKLWVRGKSDTPAVTIQGAAGYTLDDLQAVPGQPGHRRT